MHNHFPSLLSEYVQRAIESRNRESAIEYNGGNGAQLILRRCARKRMERKNYANRNENRNTKY